MRARRIKCFCGGAKTLLFKGKREVGNAPTSNVPTRCGFSREPERPTPRTRSTPRRTAHLNLCVCCELHARDPRKRAMPETSGPHQKQKAFGRIRAPREKFQSNPARRRVRRAGLTISPSNEKAALWAAFSFEIVIVRWTCSRVRRGRRSRLRTRLPRRFPSRNRGTWSGRCRRG